MSNHFTAIQTTKGFNVIFIHSSLDDFGLDPYTFRLYAHLCRRASSGACWSSIANMGDVCRMCEAKVKECLQRLIDMRMVLRRDRPGLTSVFNLTSPDCWSTPPMAGGGYAIDPPHGMRGDPPHGMRGDPPHGIPPEGYPIRKSNKERKKASADASVCELIYSAYPRKVGKPKALQAIARAVVKHGAETVSVAVEKFARAWEGAPKDEMQFCPHPATWFNQERYMDDPTTWRRRASAFTHPVRSMAQPNRNL